MKTIILVLSLVCICALGLAQENHNYPKLKPGVIYIFQTPEGEWIADGFPPNVDPYAIATVNPAYLFPIDGSGPIPVNDPTLVKRMNAYHLFTIDGIDPGPGPLKRRVINPNFLEPIDKIKPPTFDPSKITTSNPNFGNWQN